MTGVTLCLWYDGTAKEAATYYAATFPDSSVGAVRPVARLARAFAGAAPGCPLRR